MVSRRGRGAFVVPHRRTGKAGRPAMPARDPRREVLTIGDGVHGSRAGIRRRLRASGA